MSEEELSIGDYKVCPKCKYKYIIRWTEETIGCEYSVRTGKKLSEISGSTRCWGFICRKCGWNSEAYHE